jgi:xylulose-5-phosphate/fructose-6-phosphate phosphoketolase
MQGGSTTTRPFDVLVVNGMDRFHLAMNVIERVFGPGRRAAQHVVDKRAEHRTYVRSTGKDLPEIRDWAWPH